MTAIPKRETLNLRIQPDLRGMIDRAAELTGKSRTDFVLEAARRAAEDAMLDRTLFSVGREVYGEFLARLDAPPKASALLRESLRTTPPWDEA